MNMESDILVDGGDLLLADSRVFHIPTELALHMTGYNRLSEDEDLRPEEWEILLKDITETGFTHACAIELLNSRCHLATGNHRVHVADRLGIGSIPVFLRDYTGVCTDPRNDVSISDILNYIK